MKRFIKKALVSLLALVILTSVLSGCSGKDKKVVGTVGSYEVYYEELRCFTMQYKDLMASQYGDDIWENEATAEKYLPELREWVYSSIAANYTVLALCDDDLLKLNGTKLVDINSEEIQTVVNGRIEEMIASYEGGKSEYKQDLKDNYLTEDLYRFIVGLGVCEASLFNYYCNLGLVDDSDQAVIDYIYEKFIRTVHVYIGNNAGDNVEENRRLANALKIKIDNGEDIDEIIKNYSEDQTFDPETGIYFTHNTYPEEYERVAFALEEYSVSDVIETSSGFYIIKRLALDDEYVAESYYSEDVDLKNVALLAMFDDAAAARKPKLTFSPNEYGSSIDLIKMK